MFLTGAGGYIILDHLTVSFSLGVSYGPFTNMEPLPYVAKPVSTEVGPLSGGSGEPVCILEGDYITTFDNHTSEADVDSDYTLLSTDGPPLGLWTYSVFICPVGPPGNSSLGRWITAFISSEIYFIKPNGKDLVVQDQGDRSITVLTNEWKDLKDVSGNIIGQITK